MASEPAPVDGDKVSLHGDEIGVEADVEKYGKEAQQVDVKEESRKESSCSSGTHETRRTEREEATKGSSRKHKFYVSTTEAETEDTEVETDADKGRTHRRESEHSDQHTNSTKTTTASLSVHQLLSTKLEQAQPRASGHGGAARSLSEVLRAKLSALPSREEGNFTLGFTKVFHTRTRFLMMILCLLCLASIWSNILCFNFALICIDHSDEKLNAAKSVVRNDDAAAAALIGNGTTQNTTTNENDDFNDTTNNANGTEIEGGSHSGGKKRRFSSRQQLYLTSAVAAAALIANFAIVSLVNNYGIRTTFAALGMLSAVTTCLLPAAIELGFYYVLACRLLQGVAFSANFPVIGAFTSKWTYYKQNGLFVSALVAYVQFAPAITLPVSGVLCESLGWPSVFFAHGGYSCVLFCLFGAFFRNSPGKHPFVGEVELRKIAVGKSELSKEMHKRIPWKEIVQTGSVWAVWIAAVGNFVCVNMMFLYSPSYLNSVLHFPVAHTGFSASLAPLAQFGIKLCAGFTSDKIRTISETNKLRLYNSIAFFGSAIFLAMLAFFPAEHPTMCLGLLGLSAGLLGFTTGGFFKAGPLVAKHYALVVMGQISLAITITLLLVPMMQNTVAPHNTAEEWRNVFLITAGTLVLTNLAFCLLCSAKPAEWTTDDFSRNASSNKIHSTEALNVHKLNVPHTLG